MYNDKKRAIHKTYRIPERTLFLIAWIGGSIGSLLGMYHFRHKTKHAQFVYGIPFILLVQGIFFYFIGYLFKFSI
jgi:uncharacterized membrane protein YsdA (DUF1294 family)